MNPQIRGAFESKRKKRKTKSKGLVGEQWYGKRKGSDIAECEGCYREQESWRKSRNRFLEAGKVKFRPYFFYLILTCLIKRPTSGMKRPTVTREWKIQPTAQSFNLDADSNCLRNKIFDKNNEKSFKEKMAYRKLTHTIITFSTFTEIQNWEEKHGKNMRQNVIFGFQIRDPTI